jgi:hypothetical protein
MSSLAKETVEPTCPSVVTVPGFTGKRYVKVVAPV